MIGMSIGMREANPLLFMQVLFTHGVAGTLLGTVAGLVLYLGFVRLWRHWFGGI
jgi:hypothetical protein